MRDGRRPLSLPWLWTPYDLFWLSHHRLREHLSRFVLCWNVCFVSKYYIPALSFTNPLSLLVWLFVPRHTIQLVVLCEETVVLCDACWSFPGLCNIKKISTCKLTQFLVWCVMSVSWMKAPNQTPSNSLTRNNNNVEVFFGCENLVGADWDFSWDVSYLFPVPEWWQICGEQLCMACVNKHVCWCL